MSEGRELPRCAAHGLAYDPAVSPGCVLCRNSKPPVGRPSLPPGVPSIGSGQSFPSYVPNATGSEANGVGGWTVARLILIAVCGVLQMVFSMAESPEERMLSFHLGVGLSASLLTALICLPFKSIRNLASFSKLGIVFALLGMFGTLSGAAKKVSATSEPWSGTGTLVDRGIPTGILTLRVPEAWRFQNRADENGGMVSALAAPDGSGFAWMTEKGSDFAAGFSLPEYAEAMRTVYENRLATNIKPAEPATLGGMPAMRSAIEGTYKGLRVKGYLYVAKGRSDFCHLVAFAPPSKFDVLERNLTHVLANAVIN